MDSGSLRVLSGPKKPLIRKSDMKLLKFMALAAVFASLAACSSKGSKATEEETQDSAQTARMEQEVPGLPVYTLTKDSIGPVFVGEKIDEIPPAVANLYDTVLPTETPDAMAYTYILGDVPQFTIYDFMEGRADVILLEGNARAVATPDGDLRIGDEFKKVLALPGVQSEFERLDDEGIWYWLWNGLYFGVDEADLPASLAEALCNGQRPPMASSFTPDIKIGYIGTGLPF